MNTCLHKRLRLVPTYLFDCRGAENFFQIVIVVVAFVKFLFCIINVIVVLL